MIYLLKFERVEWWPSPSLSVKALLYKGREEERKGERRGEERGEGRGWNVAGVSLRRH